MAVVFPYVKNTTWADGSGGTTPITAAKLNIYEDGIFNMHNAPAVRAYNSTAQSIADSTFVNMSYDSERFDQAGGAASTQHDTVTNNSRLTCRYAGIYLITNFSSFTANGTGLRSVLIRLNGGGTTIAGADVPNNGAGAGVQVTVTGLWSLAVNDYVQSLTWQSSGGALTVASELMMVRVG